MCKRSKTKLSEHTEKLRKIVQKMEQDEKRIRDIEHKKQQYRWNHPNWFARKWWRFYISFDPIGPHQ